MKCIAHWSLPGYFMVIRGRALAAKQVDAQRCSDFWGAGVQRLPRYAHRAVPKVCRRINPRRDCESGVPRPTLFVVRLVQINIEVNPLALRRDLQLLVAPDILKVGSEKHFSNVPVPKLVGFLLGVRRGFEIQLLIGANKQEVKMVRGPTRADFGAVGGNYLPMRVFIHGDARRFTPKLRRRIETQNDILFCLHAFDHGRLPGKCRGGRQCSQHKNFSEAIHRGAPSRTRRLPDADRTYTRDRFLRSGPETDPPRDRGTSGLRASPVAVKSREFRGRTREIDAPDQRWRNSRL